MSDENKSFFESMIKRDEPMSLLLSGPAGNGKTTASLAIVKSMNADYLFLNGSGKDRGIDTVKGKIEFFAQTQSLDGNRKVIIYDEADSITTDAQMALRSLIESVGTNCHFVLTANFPQKIIDPIISRCHQIDLSLARDKKTMLAMAHYCSRILDAEGVSYSRRAVANIVKANFPDIRKTVNNLQVFSMDGSITEDDAAKIAAASMSEFYKIMRSKKFGDLYAWVNENVRNPEEVIDSMWNGLVEYFEPKSYPYVIVHLDDAQDRMTRSVNKIITLVACCAKIMSDAEFLKDE